MNRTDNDFFEEYKRLEKLCKDLFSSKEGVNEYINEMKLEEHGEKLVKS